MGINTVGNFQRVIILPQAIQRRLEAAAEKFIYPEPGVKGRFSHPEGEPALVAPDSLSWQVFKNPLALFIGGVAAVILELAEPRVRTGVWGHTTFRHDPLPRLQRTGLAAMMTVYGPSSQVEALTNRVARMHSRISGVTPGGLSYRADDPELLNWVHVTASFGFLEAYRAYVCNLDEAKCDRFYEEGASSARLYGASGAPASQLQAVEQFQSMHDKLEPSPIVFEFLDLMRHVPLLPRPFGPIQALLIKAAVEIVPPWIRERLELTACWNLAAWQRQAVKCLGAVADRVVLKSGPAVQSCRRLGLPDDYLYRRRLT
jgi:uncharacterized protein (DUF2236 family)